MKKEIPFLSVQEVNEISDYERFYHSKAYLKQKSGKLTFFKNQVDEIKELAAKCGYKKSKFSKFVEHRKEWHSFNRKIPLLYLDAIEVKLDVLKYTIELDKRDFKKALKLSFHPRYAIIQMRPLSMSKTFPPGISEKEAIIILKDYAIKKNRTCLINYPHLKTISIFPDGNVYTKYYEPDIKVTKLYAVPTESGNYIGKIYFK